MSLTLMRDLYEYHRWANHRLFDVAVALGEDACARELGKPFSVPTVTRMFAHVYGADLNWLKRSKGSSASESPFSTRRPGDGAGADPGYLGLSLVGQS